MSSERESKTEWSTPVRDKDAVNNRRMVGIAFATLAVFTFFVVGMFAQLQFRQRHLNPGGAEIPKVLGKAEINIVNQSLMVLDTRAYQQREQKRQQLHSYGWVDRERNVVHIPIHEAIRRVVEEERARREGERR